MNSSRARISVFRTFLTAALLGILFLATTPIACPIGSDINDKLNHVAAFFVLAVLMDFSFPETKNRPALTLALLGYGAAIEIIQHFLPWRMFSLLDVAADALGIACGQTALFVLRKRARRSLTENNRRQMD